MTLQPVTAVENYTDIYIMFTTNVLFTFLIRWQMCAAVENYTEIAMKEYVNYNKVFTFSMHTMHKICNNL